VIKSIIVLHQAFRLLADKFTIEKVEGVMGEDHDGYGYFVADDGSKVLTELLVHTAKSDKSAPPCWRMDQVLGAIEGLVGREWGDYTMFAKIAGQAMRELHEHKGSYSENTVLLQLAILNGLRRSDGDGTHVTEVQNLFNRLKSQIDVLDDGPRKRRCLSFFLYQQQVFSARCGFYAEAAKAAEDSAVLCDEPHNKAISLYLARVYTVWAAVMSDVYADVGMAFGKLKAELPLLQQAVAGTNMELQWGKGNGPICLLQAMILDVFGDDDLWNTNMALVLAHEAELGEVFKPGIIDILKAEEKLRDYAYEDGVFESVVKDMRAIVANPASLSETKAWANLLLAFALIKSDDFSAASDVLKQITPTPDAHMVAAVAQRILKDLDLDQQG